MHKAITIKGIGIDGSPGKPGAVYYPLNLVTIPTPEVKDGEVLVRVLAAALNHRDLFLRQHLYPAISFTTPLLSDGCGIVVQSPRGTHRAGHDRVIFNPGSGWVSDPDGPENNQIYKVFGGTELNPIGTLQEYIVIPASELEIAPAHLTDVEAAGLPLAGLTAWRAFRIKSNNAEAGRNIVITGIGGGVALMALQFAVATKCNVFVTSSSEKKIARAKDLGARGGVIYKEADWVQKLASLLPSSRPYIDAIIDGAGGDIVLQTYKLLKPGGVVVSYGMTTSPKLTFPMQAVMKNIEVRGSTMGSRSEFSNMVEFVAKKRIRPVIERVVEGLLEEPELVEGLNGLFDDMKEGRQFGKLVVRIKEVGKVENGKGSNKL